MPRILAVANQKGGVGKTTTVVSVAANVALSGKRTLLIDLDPQGNATTGLGVSPHDVESSSYNVVVQQLPIRAARTGTVVEGLDLLPATMDLAGAEIELVPMFSRELRLRSAISLVEKDYDYIFIDCPPSLGMLTVNSLAAAAEVVVPLQCEYYALEGLTQLLKNVQLVREGLNPELEVTAIVLVMFDARTRLAQEVAEEVRAHFGDLVLTTVVPRSVRLSEAPSYGQPIELYDPSSRGAAAYRAVANEIIRRQLTNFSESERSP
ncbi:MAG: AAA family ATPase [Actinomycetota bacterium]|nr:AAA family ATPase [Actinomycetota bacterium]